MKTKRRTAIVGENLVLLQNIQASNQNQTPPVQQIKTSISSSSLIITWNKEILDSKFLIFYCIKISLKMLMLHLIMMRMSLQFMETWTTVMIRTYPNNQCHIREESMRKLGLIVMTIHLRMKQITMYQFLIQGHQEIQVMKVLKKLVLKERGLQLQL